VILDTKDNVFGGFTPVEELFRLAVRAYRWMLQHPTLSRPAGAWQEGRLTCRIRELPANGDNKGNDVDDIHRAQPLPERSFEERFQHDLRVASQEGHFAKNLFL
jgi:hypothetical protein